MVGVRGRTRYRKPARPGPHVTAAQRAPVRGPGAQGNRVRPRVTVHASRRDVSVTAPHCRRLYIMRCARDVAAQTRSARRETEPAGGHRIHLHAVGSCTPNFKAATGHVNPGKVKHGLRNPEGPDNGDLPNLFAAADGSARAEFFTSRVSVSGGDMAALLDEDGSAVIIHENPDDHMAQPIGGAAARIGCGIIGKM